MAILGITGTNTDVGKTVATATLALGYKSQSREVIAVKPVQTGEPAGEGDAYTVAQLAGVETVDFLRFPEPLAPNLSARRAGMPQPELADVAAQIRELDSLDRVVLVEGAGGLLVRIADTWNFADLMRELGAPIVIVTSTGLGSLNLVELTAEAARARGVAVAGIIGGRVPRELDLATELNLSEFSVVGSSPYLGSIHEGDLSDLGQVQLQLPKLWH